MREKRLFYHIRVLFLLEVELDLGHIPHLDLGQIVDDELVVVEGIARGIVDLGVDPGSDGHDGSVREGHCVLGVGGDPAHALGAVGALGEAAGVVVGAQQLVRLADRNLRRRGRT